MPICKCFEPPFYYKDYDIVDLGMDSNYGDVTIHTCKKCKNKWLKYLIEEEHYTKSGRWWRAPIDVSVASTLLAENAKELLESLEWCFIGGSYYEGQIQKAEKPIEIK